MATNPKNPVFKSACVLTITHGDIHANKGSCCGILIDSSIGYVLTHGSILASCLLKGSSLNQGEHNLNTFLNYKSLTCEVLVEESPDLWNSNKTGNMHEASGIETAVTSVSTENQTSNDLQHIKGRSDMHSFVSFSASIVGIFKCSEFQSALERLMPDSSWELVDRKGEKQNSDDTVLDDTQNQDIRSLLSYFVLLKLHNWTPYESKEVVRPAEHCQIGEQVEICSTPFGGFKPEAFLNSYSHGIISNLAGRDNCLILSDARCIPGGEGAPLYTIIHSKRYLTGIVVASLCWKNDEWIGFCISCAIDKVLDSLPTGIMSCIDRQIRGVSSTDGREKSLLGDIPLFPAIVLLQVGKTWGSGVIIGKKEQLVLTCSHVIKDADLFPVEAKISSDGMLIKTEVIHRQHPLHHQFDLGLVRLSCGEQQLGMRRDIVECGKPTVGMKVFAVGYGVFGAEHNLAPSVTSGVISKVLHFKHIPVMIQTTCAVHPGASGGALVDGLGRLLGIVVCNIRDNSSGASFPHVNMSIPVCTVWPVISKFLVTGDAECLQALIVKNKLLDSLWSLGKTAASSHSKHYDIKVLKLQVVISHSVIPWLVLVIGGSTWIDASADKACHMPVLGDSEQVLHRMTSPLFDICKPVLRPPLHQPPARIP